jgi:hypothetical protein
MGTKKAEELFKEFNEELKCQFQTQCKPNYAKDLFSDKGVFKIKIIVSCENVEPASIELKFTWNGEWDNFEMEVWKD